MDIVKDTDMDMDIVKDTDMDMEWKWTLKNYFG
jgi:hypothetical protein